MEKVFSERLMFIINKLGYNKNSFSAAIGLSNNVTIGRIVNENRMPSWEILDKILQTFGNINANWLLAGRGEPFLNEQELIEYAHKKNLEVNEPPADYNSEKISSLYKNIGKLEYQIELLKEENEKLKQQLDSPKST